MTKRAPGEGSIQKLPSGKYRGRVSVKGGRLSFTADRKEDVAEWIRKTTNQAKRGLAYKGAKVTTGEYLQRWFSSVENSLRESTKQHYSLVIDKHLTPRLGDIPIKDLTADRLQFIYDSMVHSGIGAHTVHKAHAVLRQALERAKKTGLTHSNVADLVHLPKTPHKEMLYWHEGEVNQFLTAARQNRLYALFHLALNTGARQSELLGLLWKDFDIERRMLHIRRQLDRSGGFAPLKTKAATRIIEGLGKQTILALKEHYQRQEVERRFAGKKWANTGLIFTTTKGTPIKYKNLIDRYFKPIVKAAGVRPVRFHDLRHSFAAIALSQGVPVYHVSKMLGHSKASITTDIYGHLIPGATVGISQLMDDLTSPIQVDIPSVGHGLDTAEIKYNEN
jgi:integrase